jgi:hypothetical protein
MNTCTHPAPRPRPLIVVAGILIVCWLVRPASVLAADAATSATEAIAVHAGYYVLQGRAYDDLNTLESAVRARAPTHLHIVWCDSAATRAWLALVHRFDKLAQRTQVVDTGGLCRAPALTNVGASTGPLPRGIDDAAVQRYWASMP